MQSSSVQVPCKSGSPHGVFSCVQPAGLGTGLAACASAGPEVSANRAAATIKVAFFIRLSFDVKRRSGNYFFFRSP